jgi:hypothetical protein
MEYPLHSDGRPTLLLADGALCHRGFGAMAERLAPNFTVFNYERCGRGQSGPTSPVRRQARGRDAGGSAYAFGASSAAALALETAARLA